jgi:uncharacterized protein YjiS (DUF1127 family)
MVLNLNSNEFLRLSGARGTTVEVLDGRVWITEAGRANDALVAPGMRYRVDGNGLVVIGTETDAGRRPSRIAVWPPVWRWLQARVAVVAKRLADGMLERHTLKELESLSDHSLRDIGLTRGDIECAARRAVC